MKNKQSSLHSTTPYSHPPKQRRIIHRRLKSWYKQSARNLPWRQTNDPYRIWLSEIMLQQTRVEAGINYYTRFLERFPTLNALASADEQEILHCWEGLGYYSRARNLHMTAKILAETGAWPETPEALRKLPGIGPYTAGAIASIAFHRRAAVVDGNIKRVLARLLRIELCIDSGAGESALWQAANDLLPRSGCGDWNQALMELGARICLPRAPRCAECPIAAACEANLHGLTSELPVRKPRTPVPHKHVAAAAILRDGHVLLLQRPPDRMLGGLWEFPGGTIDSDKKESDADALRRIGTNDLGRSIKAGAMLAAIDHAYSHFSMTLRLYRGTIRGTPTARRAPALRWVPLDALTEIPMPRADRLACAHLPEPRDQTP